MEINVGMTKQGLRILARDIIDACDKADASGAQTIEKVVRYIPNNGSGEELTLGFDNDDMSETEHQPDASYYEIET